MFPTPPKNSHCPSFVTRGRLVRICNAGKIQSSLNCIMFIQFKNHKSKTGMRINESDRKYNGVITAIEEFL